MNIIFCKWTSICEDAIDTALVQLNCNITRITRLLDSVDYDTDYMSTLSQTLSSTPADCVLSVNFIPVIARVCNVYKIPYLCLIVDSPCFQLYSDTIRLPYNRIFIFDRDLYRKFHNENPSCIFHIPLASDVAFWDSVPVRKEDHASYDCDISFVGSLYSEKCRYNQIEQSLPPQIRGYADGLIEAQLHMSGANLLRESISQEFAEKFKACAKWVPLEQDYREDTIGIVADTYLGYKCTEQDRIRKLNALADHFSVDLYTLSDTSSLPKIHNKGPADSRNMMPQIIKCSKINLNFTNIPISSGLPQRIFDILGCGGFLMTNFQPELLDWFVPDEDLVIYYSTSDLIEKTAYYLEHEEERRAIAQNGYRKTASQHTYALRLVQMFELALKS